MTPIENAPIACIWAEQQDGKAFQKSNYFDLMGASPLKAGARRNGTGPSVFPEEVKCVANKKNHLASNFI